MPFFRSVPILVSLLGLAALPVACGSSEDASEPSENPASGDAQATDGPTTGEDGGGADATPSDGPLKDPTWTTQFIGLYPSCVTFDSKGSIIAGGRKLDEQTPPKSQPSIRKMDARGVEQWSKVFDHSGNVPAIATDPSDNIFIVGRLARPGGTGVNTSDGFVRKLDPSGNELWTRQIVGSAEEDLTGVATNAKSEVAVVLNFSGKLESDPTTVAEVAIRLYDASGNVLWTKMFGSPGGGASEASAIAFDAAGNIIVAGNTPGQLTDAPNAGGRDAFVRKYDPTGNVLWTKQFGSVDSDYANDVSVDPRGNVVVAGMVSPVQGPTSTAFVRAFDANGNDAWNASYTLAAKAWASGVKFDTSGNVWVAGSVEGAVEAPAGTPRDIFIAKYAGTTGAQLGIKTFGTTYNDEAVGVAASNAGRIVVVGSSNGPLFGPYGRDPGLLIGF